MRLYMRVSEDEYELPEVVANTQQELADLCGVSYATISNSLFRARNWGIKSKYIVVEVDDDE